MRLGYVTHNMCDTEGILTSQQKKTFLSHTVLDNRPLLLLLLHSMVCKSISLSLSSFSLPLYISFTIPSGIEMRIKVSSSKYTFSFVYQGYIKIKQFKKEPTSIYLTKMLTTFSLRSVCYTLFQQHLNLKMWNSWQIGLHGLIQYMYLSSTQRIRQI